MVKRKIESTEKKQKKQSLPPTKCKGCDTNFVPKDRRQHFHSKTCRAKYYDRVYFHKETKRKKCPNCDTVFVTSMPKKQVYCNEDCRKEYQRKQNEELTESIGKDKIKFYGNRYQTLQSANFKCSFCGKDVSDNVKLDVEPDEHGGYRTICSECIVGRNYSDQ